MERIVGIDINNVRRVWGEGESLDVAETRARDAALDYVRRRPDTGPLDQWLFLRASANADQAP